MRSTTLQHKAALTSAALLFFIPFLCWNHLPPLSGFYPQWWAALLGLGSLLVFFGAPSRHFALPLIGLVPLLLCLVLIAQLLTGLAFFPSSFYLAALALLWATTLTLAGRALADALGTARIARTMAWALLAGGALNTLAGILQHWQIHTLLDPYVVAATGTNVAYGNLAQSNHLADYLGLGLASLLYLSGYAGLPRRVAAPLGLWLLFGLSLTASRSAWLYLATLTVLAVGWHRHQRSRQSHTMVSLALATLPLFLLLQFVLPELPGTVTANERLVAGAGLQVRLALWKHAIQMFLDHPLLGVGYQHFAWENFLLTAHNATHGPVAQELHMLPFTQAHNLALQWLAEWGLGGAIALLVLAYWLITRIRLTWTAERWWGWAIVSVLGIHSLLEFPLWYTYFLGIFAFIAGMLDEAPTSPMKVTPHLASLMGGIALLVGGTTLAVLMIGYRPLQRAYAFDPATNPAYSRNEMHADLLRASASGLFAPEVEHYYAVITVDSSRPKSWPILLKLNSAAAHVFPNSGMLYRQTLLLALDKDLPQALRLLDKTALVYPDYLPEFLVGLQKFGLDQPEVASLYRAGLALSDALPKNRHFQKITAR